MKKFYTKTQGLFKNQNNTDETYNKYFEIFYLWGIPMLKIENNFLF